MITLPRTITKRIKAAKRSINCSAFEKKSCDKLKILCLVIASLFCRSYVFTLPRLLLRRPRNYAGGSTQDANRFILVTTLLCHDFCGGVPEIMPVVVPRPTPTGKRAACYRPGIWWGGPPLESVIVKSLTSLRRPATKRGPIVRRRGGGWHKTISMVAQYLSKGI
jgi:hypothetical protein